MSRIRVVVTGLGATTPLGGDVSSTWENLLAGKSGVAKIKADWADDLPVKIAAQAAPPAPASGTAAPPAAAGAAPKASDSAKSNDAKKK